MSFKIFFLALVIDKKISNINTRFLSCFFLVKDILEYNSFFDHSFST